MMIAGYVIGLALVFGLAFIPANIAKRKGYSFAGFYVLSVLFFIIGLIIALCLDDRNSEAYKRNYGYYYQDGQGYQNNQFNQYNRGYQNNQSEQQGAKVFCPYCGKPVEVGQKFCVNCGGKL